MLLPNIYLRNQNFAARELFENRPAEYNSLFSITRINVIQSIALKHPASSFAEKPFSPSHGILNLAAWGEWNVAPAKYICAELKFRWRVRINARPREIYFSQN